MKNAFLKVRKVDNPYMKFYRESWEWRVLKLYKNPVSSLGDRFSRAYCAVMSPFTMGAWEYGDSYVYDIPGLTERLVVEARYDSTRT